MNKSITFLILLVISFQSCTKETYQIGASTMMEAKLDMTVKAGSDKEKQNLIKNMRIFLFETGGDGILRYEITGLKRTETKVSSTHVPVGNWNMVAVSHLGTTKESFHMEYSKTTEQLLYKFTPGTNVTSPNVGGDCPEVVMLSESITITDKGKESITANFQRAVGKVEILITEAIGIDLTSQEHTVEIIGVPTSLSFDGGLLKTTNGALEHSRLHHDILNSESHKMIRSIQISSNTPFSKATFIIPAYDDMTRPTSESTENDINKKLYVKIRLKTTDNGFYENMAEVPKSLAANKTLRISLTVSANINVDIKVGVSVLEWIDQSVIIPPFE